LPTVAVHDLEVHARDGDLVAATHGRGLWILDDITPLQQITPEVRREEARLLQNRVATQWLNIQPQHGGGALAFQGRNPSRNAVINYFLSDRVTGNVEFAISGPDGASACRATVPAEPGVGRLEWTMRWSEGPGAAGRGGPGGRGAGGAAGAAAGQGRGGGAPTCLRRARAADGAGGGGRRGGGGGGRGGGAAGRVEPGTYAVTMVANGTTYRGTITVRADPMRR
jgi:hypothetical protein